MIDILRNSGLWLDVILIIIPTVICIILIFKFAVPKRPVIGMGLAAGAGLLGYFLVKRRLKNAFDVEKKIAEHNQAMTEFKEKQKTRAELVLANNQVIKTLEKQNEKLGKKADKYKTEIQLIDEELKDRRALNEQLLKSSGAFLESTKNHSQERKELLRRFEEQSGYLEDDEPNQNTAGSKSGSASDIEIDGYRLLEE